MADVCAHCASTDVMHGFDTFQCLTCGRITGPGGTKLLPDSLVYEPNHDAATEQFGWPFDDQAPTIARGHALCATQWGTPIQGAEMSEVQPPETPPVEEEQPLPEPPAQPEVENVPAAPEPEEALT